MFWGFSESQDLYDEYTKNIEAKVSELDILLIGSGDPRHILHTIAKSYKHDCRINFYVLEGCIEITARYILLLSIALESGDISLRGKTNLFMDVFGNTLLRPISYNYVASKADILTKIVTDSDYLAEKAPVFDFEDLKYRERDNLNEAFHFWTAKEGHVFDIKSYWENRVRQLLGSRYDYRNGAFDWDLQMKLKEREAMQICPQEYQHWRDTGVAFVFPEFEQSMSNKTLAAGLVRNGPQYRHRGYVGDITVGPFCSFGLSTRDSKMTNSFHGTNDFRATDLTERNLLELFYEIQNSSEYTHDEGYDRKFGAICLDIAPHLNADENEGVNLKKYDKPLIATPMFKIKFLSIEEVLKIKDNLRLKNRFDLAFVGNKYFQFFENDFLNVCKDKCLVMFETQSRSVLKKEQVSEFQQKIRNYAKANNLQEITKFNINIHYSVVKYKLSRNEDSV